MSSTYSSDMVEQSLDLDAVYSAMERARQYNIWYDTNNRYCLLDPREPWAILISESLSESLLAWARKQPVEASMGVAGPLVCTELFGLKVFTVTDAEAETIAGMGKDYALFGPEAAIVAIVADIRGKEDAIDDVN